MANAKKSDLKGMVIVEIIKPLTGSSYKEGDKATYHCSMANKLIDLGVAKLHKKIQDKDYKPKAAK